MKKPLLFFVLILPFFIFKVNAQESPMEELAKASQNPVADMNSVPFQFNWISGGGFGNQALYQLLVQPVLPMAISKNWNIVSRTIVPVVSTPPSTNGTRAKGIGDIQEQIFFSQSHPGKVIWGFGIDLSFPTATNESLVSGQFAAGPAFVVLAMPGHWVLGAITNNIWRYAGSTSTTAISSFFIQPFINYNLKRGWTLSTAPSITSNWNAETGQQWTVPVGIGVSKITLVGKQPLSVGMQYYHNVVRPDAYGSDQLRMVVSFLFPKKMAATPKEDEEKK